MEIKATTVIYYTDSAACMHACTSTTRNTPEPTWSMPEMPQLQLPTGLLTEKLVGQK